MNSGLFRLEQFVTSDFSSKKNTRSSPRLGDDLWSWGRKRKVTFDLYFLVAVIHVFCQGWERKRVVMRCTGNLL